jgi:hypothetical protein
MLKTTTDNMAKIFNKWYFGLIAIPIFINLLTNSIGLPDLFNEWTTTVIATLSFLAIILSTELIFLSKKIREIEFIPKESDKRIIKKLLITLDVDAFHEDIKDQDSWYGYKKEAIRKIIDFAQDAGLISNKTSDIKLNNLLLDLKNAIDDFDSYCSTQLYGNGDDWYSPAKDIDFNVEKAKIAQPIMNAKSETAFMKLTLLLDYLKQKNYLE